MEIALFIVMYFVVAFIAMGVFIATCRNPEDEPVAMLVGILWPLFVLCIIVFHIAGILGMLAAIIFDKAERP